MGELTIKQKRFCDGYLKSGNATQSYINAGYNVDYDTAMAGSSRMLRNVKVQNYIQMRQQKIDNKHIMSIQEAQEFLTNVANKQSERTNDKLKAVELLVKMQGGFLDRVNLEASVSVGYEDKLKALEDKSEF